MKYEEVKETSGGFYPIYKFMERELGLRCNELRVYALLFSFTMGKVGMFYGSRKYLAESLSVSERSIYRILKALFERGLIENVCDRESGRSGIRCAHVREETPKKRVGDMSFIEKCREHAYDEYVRRNYGELTEEEYRVVRAAAEERFRKMSEQTELKEAVKRIKEGARR